MKIKLGFLLFLFTILPISLQQENDCDENQHYWPPVDKCYSNHGISCNETSECNEFKYFQCVTQEVGNSSICQCADGFLYDPLLSECRGGAFTPCDLQGPNYSNISCVPFAHCVKENGGESTCTCNDGYRDFLLPNNEIHICSPLQSSNCSESSPCHAKGYLNCKSGTCECNAGYSIDLKKPGFCYGDLNALCSGGNHCHLEKFLQCTKVQGRPFECICSPYYDYDEEKDKCVVTVLGEGGICRNGDYETDCSIKYAECKESSNECHCKEGYEGREGSYNCLGLYGSPCSSNTDCASLRDLECESQTCLCKDGFIYKNGRCVEDYGSGGGYVIKSYNPFIFLTLLFYTIVHSIM